LASSARANIHPESERTTPNAFPQIRMVFADLHALRLIIDACISMDIHARKFSLP